MKYILLKAFSYSYDRIRYQLFPGDEVTFLREHLPEQIAFGDKAHYKEFRDSQGREFFVFPADFAKFKIKN